MSIISGKPLTHHSRLVSQGIIIFLLRRARKAARRKDWLLAARHYQMIVRRDPNLSSAHVQLGHALLRQGAYERALDSYRQAAMLVPEEQDILLHIGHALKCLGRHDDAFQSYLAAWRAQPTFDAAAQELRELRPWIDDAWLEVARYSDPSSDHLAYFEIRAAQNWLSEPSTLQAGCRSYFRLLASSLVFRD